MPIYEHEGIVLRFPDQAAIKVSATPLLSQKAVFAITLSHDANGELFAFLSPIYTVRLAISEGIIRFQRNQYIAEASVREFQQQYLLLLSWEPCAIKLVVIEGGKDGDAISPDACITIPTDPIYVPLELINWARRLHLLPRKTYSSAAEFMGVFMESLRQARNNIRDTNSVKSFWDRQNSPKASHKLVPKREPEAMAAIATILQDQSIVANYQMIRESSIGSGSLDLRVIAPLKNDGFCTICIEAKNAHSNDIQHGVAHQLPAYMQSSKADFGIYLVLWYKCEEFNHPPSTDWELTLSLTKIKPWKTITVEKFDLSLPKSPSSRDYSFS
jgi:hypothetical protein